MDKENRGGRSYFQGIYECFVRTENTFSGESISVGYESSAAWIRKIGAEGVTFRAYMNDIFRVSSFKEERGTDYPFARTVSFSLSLRF